MNCHWKSFFTSKRRLFIFISMAFLTIFFVTSFTRFMTWSETRPGMVFDDPILKHFGPYDVSHITSFLTLFPILIGLVFIFRKPSSTIYFLLSGIFICIFRTLTIYFVPLEAPEHIIPLTDPIIENLFYKGQVLLKDLFFSGHTANLFLVGFLVENVYIKRILLSSGFVVGILLMYQHVHYSIDVFAAPFFAILTYKLSILVGNKLVLNEFGCTKNGRILPDLMNK